MFFTIKLPDGSTNPNGALKVLVKQPLKATIYR